MRRHFLTGIAAAALLTAGSAWAAPNSAASTSNNLNQIAQQTYQIESQADQLEAYVRSGAHAWTGSSAYTFDMTEDAQKLLAELDQVAARPGATNDTRIRVQKMKTMTYELMAFAGGALRDLEQPRALALRSDNVFANTSNIEERCNLIRVAAQDLANAR